jgi:hypothetical protein
MEWVDFWLCISNDIATFGMPAEFPQMGESMQVSRRARTEKGLHGEQEPCD